MPLILAGLAWLGSAIAAIITGVVQLFSVWITKRVLVSIALTGAFVAIVLLLFAAIGAVIDGITVTLPTGYHQAVGMFLPSNAYTCASAVITTYVARWVYEQKVKILDYVAQS